VRDLIFREKELSKTSGGNLRSISLSIFFIAVILWLSNR